MPHERMCVKGRRFIPGLVAMAIVAKWREWTSEFRVKNMSENRCQLTCESRKDKHGDGTTRSTTAARSRSHVGSGGRFKSILDGQFYNVKSSRHRIYPSRMLARTIRRLSTIRSLFFPSQFPSFCELIAPFLPATTRSASRKSGTGFSSSTPGSTPSPSDQVALAMICRTVNSPRPRQDSHCVITAVSAVNAGSSSRIAPIVRQGSLSPNQIRQSRTHRDQSSNEPSGRLRGLPLAI